MTSSDSTSLDTTTLNLSNVILVSLVAGTSLFIVNTVILGTHAKLNLTLTIFNENNWKLVNFPSSGLG